MKQIHKMHLSLAILFSVAFGHVQGDDSSNVIDYCEPFYCEYNPCCDEDHFFFKVDALYWRAHQDGLERVVHNEVRQTFRLSGNPSFTASTDRLKNSRFISDWRGGYRLGIGYDWCGWTMALDWTHYRGHAHNHGKQGSLRRSGHWKIDYDVVDFIIGTPSYCVGSCFNWNAFGGVRSARINQNLRAHIEGLSSFVNQNNLSVSTTIIQSTTDIRDHEHFNGVGPEIGLNANWDLGCGFSLYGNATGAIVFGRFHDRVRSSGLSITDSETDGIPTEHTEFNNTNRFSSHDRVCEPVLDLGLGICWCTHLCYCNCETDLVLKLGWEHHQWFNHGHLENFFVGVGDDLCFDGLTFSAALFY